MQIQQCRSIGKELLNSTCILLTDVSSFDLTELYHILIPEWIICKGNGMCMAGIGCTQHWSKLTEIHSLKAEFSWQERRPENRQSLLSSTDIK